MSQWKVFQHTHRDRKQVIIDIGLEFISDFKSNRNLVKLSRVKEICVGKGSTKLQDVDSPHNVCFSITQRKKIGLQTINFESINATDRVDIIRKLMHRLKCFGWHSESDRESNDILRIKFGKDRGDIEKGLPEAANDSLGWMPELSIISEENMMENTMQSTESKISSKSLWRIYSLDNGQKKQMILSVGSEFLVDHKGNEHGKPKGIVKLSKIQQIHLGKRSDVLQGIGTRRSLYFSIIQRKRSGLQVLDFETFNEEDRTSIIINIINQMHILGIYPENGLEQAKRDVFIHMSSSRILKIQFAQNHSEIVPHSGERRWKLIHHIHGKQKKMVMIIGSEFITDGHQSEHRTVHFTDMKTIHLGKASNGLQDVESPHNLCFSIIRKDELGKMPLDFEAKTSSERLDLILELIVRMPRRGLHVQSGRAQTRRDMIDAMKNNGIMKIHFSDESIDVDSEKGFNDRVDNMTVLTDDDDEECWKVLHLVGKSGNTQMLKIKQKIIKLVDPKQRATTLMIEYKDISRVRVYDKGPLYYLFIVQKTKEHGFVPVSKEDQKAILSKLIRNMERFGKVPNNGEVASFQRQIRILNTGDGLDILYDSKRELSHLMSDSPKAPSRGPSKLKKVKTTKDHEPSNSKWKLYHHENEYAQKMIMIIGSELITDKSGTEERSVNLRKIQEIYLGKASKGLQHVASPHNVCFSIIQNETSGPKTLDFEARNAEDRTKIIDDIFFLLSKV